jgi:hypothetical protein
MENAEKEWLDDGFSIFRFHIFSLSSLTRTRRSFHATLRVLIRYRTDMRYGPRTGTVPALLPTIIASVALADFCLCDNKIGSFCVHC